ncbi:MAG: flagellar basal body P-ring formation protein FlgA [Deltaproteobacteria bacterium]|nr:flagellar basal body P-ring formation protein FlgA [Deltaproteobacteria bacterium]
MKKAILITLLVLALPALSYGLDVDAEIKSALVKVSPWSGTKVEVEEIEVPGIEKERFDAIEVRLPNAKAAGKVAFQAVLKTGGKETKTLWGSARIRVYRDALVALRALKMKSKPSPDDVKLVSVEVRDAPDAVASIDELDGMVVKRPISAGSIIKRDYLKLETVVRKGDRVTVWVEGRSVRVKTAAIASEDGGKGAVITARALSGREINGVVRGPGELLVEF